MKKRTVFSTFLLIMMSAVLTNHIVAGASDGSPDTRKMLQRTYEYTADSPERKDGDFEQTVKKNGKTYQLSGIRYEVIKKSPVTKKKQVSVTVLSKAADSAEAAIFEDTVNREGITYQIDRSSIKESGETHVQEVTAYEDYSSIVTRSSVPQTKTVSIVNEITGEEETVECSIQNITRLDDRWQDSYIDITFQGYDSGMFNWNGMQVSLASMGNTPLAGYETQLLASVGLSPDKARVMSTYWAGEAYSQNGTVCRNARADIQRAMPVYRVNYSGEIISNVYEAVYNGIEEETVQGEYIYDMRATADYELKSHLTQYVTAGVVIVLLALMLILFIISRKNQKKEEEEPFIEN